MDIVSPLYGLGGVPRSRPVPSSRSDEISCCASNLSPNPYSQSVTAAHLEGSSSSHRSSFGAAGVCIIIGGGGGACNNNQSRLGAHRVAAPLLAVRSWLFGFLFPVLIDRLLPWHSLRASGPLRGDGASRGALRSQAGRRARQALGSLSCWATAGLCCLRPCANRCWALLGWAGLERVCGMLHYPASRSVSHITLHIQPHRWRCWSCWSPQHRCPL